MRIYWHSTAPFGGSSYSTLTRRTVPPIVRMGHEVQVGCWYGLAGEPQRWNIHPIGKPDAPPVGSVMLMPSLGHPYGCDAFVPNYETFKADVAIPCMDVWVLPPAMTSMVTFAPWVPINHDPVPKNILAALEPAVMTMCMSRWGTQLLKDSGVRNVWYVPCSADTNVYKPGDKALARKQMGIQEDCFLVTMIAANKDQLDRKGFGEGLQGFAKFAEKHENARLYIHTAWENGAINIRALAERCGLKGKVIQPNPYALAMGMYSEADMRTFYNATDVLLNPAKSEGFGLPILEAQLCGVPAVATDFSTTDELLFAGWKIKGQRMWSFGADSFRMVPFVESIADCLEEAHEALSNEVSAKKLAIQARNGALAYDTERVAREFWAPALAEMETFTCKRSDDLKLVTF